MYMDASIFVVDFLALDGHGSLIRKSEFQFRSVSKSKLTIIMVFFLSTDITKFDLKVWTSFERVNERKGGMSAHVNHSLSECDWPFCCSSTSSFCDMS